ncbi:MAG TPA: efflux RND transporter periplasmic adaptor subunit [Leptolyngbyaceae cyanobacterium M33_DOE_097]|nr:efflux RND transporter periplasmic adaptor subunit [Leptolyngbyaceae cyanobacterium M33_DOE_097]
MTGSNHSEHAGSGGADPLLPPSDQPALVESFSTANSPRLKLTSRKVLGLVGLFLAIAGLGFGWRWWMASQASSQAGMGGGGMPAGLPVTLETTKTQSVLEFSDFVGSLESKLAAPLRPEIAGRVSNIYVNSGARVQAGTPIVQLRPDKRLAELAGVQASVQSARAARDNARFQLDALRQERLARQADVELQAKEYRRISDLVAEGALPRQNLDQVESARSNAVAQLRAIDERIKGSAASLANAESELSRTQANANLATEELSDTVIRAPFDGVVGDIPVKLGQVVSSSDTLTTITQNESLELRLSVPLERSAELRTNQRVELLDNTGKLLAAGRITFISPQVETNVQSVLAKATFDNRDGKLRSGQFVRARLIWSEKPGVLVPTSSISRLGGETFVYIAQPLDDQCKAILSQAPPAGPPGAPAPPPPDLVARQRPVKLGRIQDNRYQILEGLKPNEQVVTTGTLNLSECAAIAPTTSPSSGTSQINRVNIGG